MLSLPNFVLSFIATIVAPKLQDMVCMSKLFVRAVLISVREFNLANVGVVLKSSLLSAFLSANACGRLPSWLSTDFDSGLRQGSISSPSHLLLYAYHCDYIHGLSN